MSKFQIGDRVRVVRYDTSNTALSNGLPGEVGTVVLVPSSRPWDESGHEYEVRLDNPAFHGGGPDGARLMYQDELELWSE